MEDNKRRNKGATSAESFHDDDSFAIARPPLTSINHFTDSPDVSQKALLAEIRKLTFKTTELQNYCDDFENEKRELVQKTTAFEKQVSDLEERCRAKERELNEIRDSANEATFLRSENDNLKDEISRLTEALRISQERVAILTALEEENNELIERNNFLDNKVQTLEAQTEEAKSCRAWKMRYEQAKAALEEAEKTIFEFVQDNERAKAVSQAEALAMRSANSQANSWGTITRAKCTCTCHHHPFADGGPSRPGSAATTTSDRCSTPSAIRPPETTQNMADISVVDISLWRDNRTASTPSEVTGECLGEVMAFDSRIQDLEAQLVDAKEEITRANDELARAAEEAQNLKSQLAGDQEELKLGIEERDQLSRKLTALENEQNRLFEREKELSTANSDLLQEALSTKAKIDHLENQRTQTEEQLRLKVEEHDQLSTKLAALEDEKSRLFGREKELSSANSDLLQEALRTKARIEELEGQLTQTEEQLRLEIEERNQLSGKLAAFEQERTVLTAREEELSSTNETLQQEISRTKARIEQMECQLTQTEEQLQLKTTEQKELSNKIADIEGRNVALSEREAATIATQKEAITKIASLEADVECLNEEVREAHAQLKSCEEAKAQLCSQLCLLQKEGIQQSDRERILAQQLTSYQAQVTEITTDLEEKKHLVDHLKMERASIIESRDNATKQLEEVQASLTQARADVSTLSSELAIAQEANQRMEHLESSLGARESSIDSLNQALSVAESEASRLTEEKCRLEGLLATTRTELESLTATHAQVASERDATCQQLSECTEMLSAAQTRATDLEASLTSLITNHTDLQKAHEELEAKHTSTNTELGDCKQQLSAALEDVAHLSSTNQRQFEDNTKLSEEAAEVRRQLGEQTTLVARLECELVTKTDDLTRLQEEAHAIEETLATLSDERNKTAAELADKTVEAERLATQLSEIQERLLTVSEDRNTLTEEKSNLEATVSTLQGEAESLTAQLEDVRRQLANTTGAQTQQEANALLERKMSRLRTDLLAAQQCEAEARQATSLAEFNQQLAEKERARLSTFIETLERRLDAAMAERLACEERLDAETVRARKLEGLLNEKETTIGSLQHQLGQVDAQRKLAEDAQTTSLMRYLLSKRAQMEAEKKLELLGGDARRSALSLDQLSATLPNPRCGLSSTLADFLDSPQAGAAAARRHSDIVAPLSSHRANRAKELTNDRPSTSTGVVRRSQLFNDVDLDRAPGEASFCKKTPTQKKSSPVFGDAHPDMRTELPFKTPMTLGTKKLQEIDHKVQPRTGEASFVTCLEDESQLDGDGAIPSSQLHFIHADNILSCTPVSAQATEALVNATFSQADPLSPQQCTVSPSMVVDNEGIQTALPEAMLSAKAVEQPRCPSASSSDSEPVSELAGWPPYSSCVAPLSPRELNSNRTFTVPAPHEFHFRRLRRLLMAPAAEEVDEEDLANSSICLETKPIPQPPTEAAIEPSHSPGSATKRRAETITESFASADITTISPDQPSSRAPLASLQPRGKIGTAASKVPSPSGTFKLDQPSAQLLQLKALRITEAQSETLLPRTPSKKPSRTVKTAQTTTYRLTLEDSDKPRVVKERPASAVFSTEARATTAPSDTSSQHTRSSSVSRPPAAKLARFRSVQDIAMGSGLPVLGKQQAVGQKSGAASLKSSRSHLAPPTAFLRFKGRFGGKSSDSDGKKKCGTISAGNTPVSSRRPSNRGDEETAVEEEMESIHLSRNSSQSSSSKSKKSSKLRLSNMFKSKNNKSW